MNNSQRLHGIDALRAIAMLLGVVFHATLAYKTVPHGPGVPHDEEFNHWLFDFLSFFIHSFRMPLFFLIAGYFCRFLYYKIGERAFIYHRLKRVAIPFVVGVFSIVPISLMPLNMYTYIYKEGLPWNVAFGKSFIKMFSINGVFHLWFLYDLLIYYSCTVVAMRVRRIIFIEEIAARISGWWSKVSFNSIIWPILLSMPIWLILIFEPDLFVFVDVRIIPKHFSYILFYGYLFLLGWFLQKRPDSFQFLIRKRNLFLGLALPMCLLLFYVDYNKEIYSVTHWWYIAKFLAAFQVMFFVLGFVGFFLHYFNAESHFWRYVSDASYWVYLTHVFFVVWLQLLFLNSQIPGILRFPLVLIITTIITFSTYQWFVRYSVIGNILNGKRYRTKAD